MYELFLPLHFEIPYVTWVTATFYPLPSWLSVPHGGSRCLTGSPGQQGSEQRKTKCFLLHRFLGELQRGFPETPTRFPLQEKINLRKIKYRNLQKGHGATLSANLQSKRHTNRVPLLQWASAHVGHTQLAYAQLTGFQTTVLGCQP